MLSPLNYITVILAVFETVVAAVEEQCRTLPGDPSWPIEDDWASFNASISGALIRTVPIASVCHDTPQYDESACAAIQAAWSGPELHYQSPHSIMASLWANQSCDPFTPRDAQCVIGTYVQYAVNVSEPDQVAKTVKFAHERNIRLVIKNTGHDYFGKSTGAGAISVWMHNLKSLATLDWRDAHYSGSALRAGAGVQGFEAVQFGAAYGLVAVTGSCPTVGVAGGYIQGGGHSSLASKFGLAADNALEFEVIDGLGNILLANRQENNELFWALCGGGGGTYGVVTSVTVKAHETFPVTTYSIGFAMAAISDNSLRAAISSFHEITPGLVDKGVAVTNSFSGGNFTLSLMAPNISAGELGQILRPLTEFLDQQEIEYNPTVAAYDSYADYYGQGGSGDYVHVQGGSWLIPRDIAMDSTKDAAYIDAILAVAGTGATIGTLGFNVSFAVAGDVQNAVLDAWRKALFYTLIVIPEPLNQTIADSYALLHSVEDKLVSKLRAIAPESGAYLNEADPADETWKRDFYGANYDRLLDVKNKYDPYHLFYGLTAVGSDYWVEKEDKRLCRAGT